MKGEYINEADVPDQPKPISLKQMKILILQKQIFVKLNVKMGVMELDSFVIFKLDIMII